MADQKRQTDEPLQYDEEGFGEKPDPKRLMIFIGVLLTSVFITGAYIALYFRT